MGRWATRSPGYIEFRVNRRFNADIQVYWERNRGRFAEYQHAKQHLFDTGLNHAANNGTDIPATYQIRDQFLNPKQKSVSVQISASHAFTFDEICTTLMPNYDRKDVASVVLKVGYDDEFGR